jgi:hypothetical protein
MTPIPSGLRAWLSNMRETVAKLTHSESSGRGGVLLASHRTQVNSIRGVPPGDTKPSDLRDRQAMSRLSSEFAYNVEIFVEVQNDEPCEFGGCRDK